MVRCYWLLASDSLLKLHQRDRSSINLRTSSRLSSYFQKSICFGIHCSFPYILYILLVWISMSRLRNSFVLLQTFLFIKGPFIIHIINKRRHLEITYKEFSCLQLKLFSTFKYLCFFYRIYLFIFDCSLKPVRNLKLNTSYTILPMANNVHKHHDESTILLVYTYIGSGLSQSVKKKAKNLKNIFTSQDQVG